VVFNTLRKWEIAAEDQKVRRATHANFLTAAGEDSAVSIHQNLQEAKIDGYVFWDQNLCIVSDAHSPISLTGIDKVKYLSIIYIILYC
jgi:hypothetical protein